ncbi:hypothetical protein [Pseudomonas syringae group genomosp. 7]|uniref:hypothetical protein n=1 Tax=Pseudomonas syringae group genomosp. 7 TaxID=251699 RepID=UPI003770655A
MGFGVVGFVGGFWGCFWVCGLFWWVGFVCVLVFVLSCVVFRWLLVCWFFLVVVLLFCVVWCWLVCLGGGVLLVVWLCF